jgi:hypothetical protein
MILLDHVVQVLRRSQPCVFPTGAVLVQLPDCAMRGGVAVKGDADGWSALRLQGLSKECLGCLHIAVGAQAEVLGLPIAIDGPEEVGPSAALDVGFIDAPRSTGPTPLEIDFVAVASDVRSWLGL